MRRYKLKKNEETIKSVPKIKIKRFVLFLATLTVPYLKTFKTTNKTKQIRLFLVNHHQIN